MPRSDEPLPWRHLCQLGDELAMSSGLSDVTDRSHHWIRAFTSAQGINVGGDVLGFCLVDGKGHGYLLSRGVFTFLDVPGTTVLAVNVSAQKAVIGSYSAPDGTGHGYIWQDGQFRTRYTWSGFHLCQRNQRGRRCRREIQDRRWAVSRIPARGRGLDNSPGQGFGRMFH